MSAPIIVPFDYNPISISQKTTSYSIQQGKYAKVRVVSPFFTINGSQIYPSMSFTQSAGPNNSSTVGYHITPGSYIYSATLTRSGSGSYAVTGSYGYGNETQYIQTFSSASRTSNGTTSLSQTNWASDIIWISANGGYSGSSTVTVNFYYFQNGSQTEFWVPSGTILNGNNYIVEEYNKIS